MNEATCRLRELMTQAFESMPSLSQEDQKTLRYNIFSAYETYLRHGFSEKQARWIIAPLLKVAYPKNVLDYFQVKLDMATISKEASVLHEKIRKLSQELRRLKEIPETEDIRRSKEHELNMIEKTIYEKLTIEGALAFLYDSLDKCSSIEEGEHCIQKFLEIAGTHHWTDDRIEKIKVYSTQLEQIALKVSDESVILPYFKPRFIRSVPSEQSSSDFTQLFLSSIDKNGEPVPNFWRQYL